MTDDVRFGLLLELDSDDGEFVRGCEVGYLQAKVDLRPRQALQELVSAANEEMVRRIARASGRRCHIERVDGEWLNVTLEPSP
jgi:hypothetical protein